MLLWLAEQPQTTWLAPRFAARPANSQASAILQSPLDSLAAVGSFADAALRPFWAAGVNGSGQVIGTGDNGIDMDSCYFKDPSVSFTTSLTFKNVYGGAATPVYTFSSATHRKLASFHGLLDKAPGAHGGASCSCGRFC